MIELSIRMVNSYLSKINFTLSGAGRQPGGAHAGMENEQM